MSKNKTNRICGIDGCGRKHQSKGLCRPHYDVYKTGRNPLSYKSSFHKNISESIEYSFLKNIEMVTESGCWIWCGNIDKDGYGILQRNKKAIKMHRYSYTRFIKDIPVGLAVCHACDIPACVNPNHLFLGTINDNNQDAINKGRAKHAIGSKAGLAKLTEGKVKDIKIKLQKGIALSALKKEYGVSIDCIRCIKNGKTWKHVDFINLT